MDGGSASEPRTDPRGGRVALVLGWLALASLVLALAVSGRGPGLYYDEAWFAQQARAFVGPARAGGMPPGVSSVVLAGRPFPTFVAPYLGALKSQLAIPALALFGARLETVRLTTLATALAALLATLLATRRLFGLPTALLAGALVAFDPTIFFHAQWEWGPFTAGFLCRALGAWLLLRSAQDGGLVSACLGGLALGASVYNRADSVVVIGAVVRLRRGLARRPRAPRPAGTPPRRGPGARDPRQRRVLDRRDPRARRGVEAAAGGATRSSSRGSSRRRQARSR